MLIVLRVVVKSRVRVVLRVRVHVACMCNLRVRVALQTPVCINLVGNAEAEFFATKSLSNKLCCVLKLKR